jgi:4-amino-4-deoxy-L-arabinose transferase-like glycosyltransferase
VSFGFWPGRLLSTLATVGTCLLIFQAIVKIRRDQLSGLVASTLFVVMPVTWAFGALQRVDVVATFFAFIPIYVGLVHADSRFAVCLAGLAAGLGFLAKPTAIAGICAVTVWLLLRREWPSLTMFVTSLGLVLSIAGGLLIVSENSGYLFNQTVNLTAPFHISKALVQTRGLVQNPSVLVSLIFLILAARRWAAERDAKGALVLLYVAGAGVLNAASATRVGANINHFSELTLALSVCAGIAGARIDDASSQYGRA